MYQTAEPVTVMIGPVGSIEMVETEGGLRAGAERTNAESGRGCSRGTRDGRGW